jgi:hypothetical protein
MESIPTYFSHSYRPEDQPCNEFFWEKFAKRGFYFSVDPPSDVNTHTHLERTMNESSCYVAVINERLESPKYRCSLFILSELGLSLQAQRPRLLIVDKEIANRELFNKFPPDEILPFSASPLAVDQEDFAQKIKQLQERALHLPDPVLRARGHIGVLVPREKKKEAYGGSKVRKVIEEAAVWRGFECKEIEVPTTHNALFALALAKCEAVLLDVRGDMVPKWVFAYIYGRMIPSIKLVNVGPGEMPSSIDLPPLVEGLRMDETEPGVESVIYWRDTNGLSFQLQRDFKKLKQRPTRLRKKHEGLSYFGTIARRPARVFISNSSAVNPLAKRLENLLTLNNIDAFQYKAKDAIPVGTNWQKKIMGEVENCDLFVALIGEGYEKSKWCMEEVNIAKKRARQSEVTLFPYKVDNQDVAFMEEFQVEGLPNAPAAAAKKVLKKIDAELKKVQDDRNWQPKQPLPLGASREAIIDALRHLTTKAWKDLLKRLAAVGIAVNAEPKRRRIQPRELAEQLVFQVQRAEITQEMAEEGVSPLARLVDELENLTEKGQQHTMNRIGRRMRETFKANSRA